MLKFLRKYNKWIMVFGGSLLMIAFLAPQAIQNLPKLRDKTVATYDGKPVIANGRNRASKEMLYATASDGATFEKRAKELRAGEGILAAIAANA